MTSPHYRLYYYQSSQIKKVPWFFKGKYTTEEKAIEDIQLYKRIREKRGEKLFYTQFILVFWEETCKDKIHKLININDV